MDKVTALKYAEKYAKKVMENYSPMAVVIYGSYLTGEADENSDIDIAVIFDGFTGDFLETSAQLYRLTCEVSTIIEPIILDIKSDNSGFAQAILEKGQRVA